MATFSIIDMDQAPIDVQVGIMALEFDYNLVALSRARIMHVVQNLPKGVKVIIQPNGSLKV